MNISFQSGQKKGKPALAFGLNNRKKTATANTTRRINNAFGDDDDESSEDERNNSDPRNQQKTNPSNRAIVNEQIAREQAARRRRAQAELVSSKDKSVFDYDGAYDSFRPKPEEASTANSDAKHPVEKKSKYIGDLLKAAKVRERERDAIYERRHAREQKAEEDSQDFRGKEKFVTSSYKRKLQERKQWEAEQEERDRLEAENDVTKKAAGTAFAGFYGNLNRSAIMEKSSTAKTDRDEEGESSNVANGKTNESGTIGNAAIMDDEFDPRQGFLGGFERSMEQGESSTSKSENHDGCDENNGGGMSSPKRSIRDLREEKVAEARKRYLKRKNAILSDQ